VTETGCLCLGLNLWVTTSNPNQLAGITALFTHVRRIAKGFKTVEILQLDRREALAAGYRRTLRRLAAVVERCLAEGLPAASGLITALQDADDHGLLGWCFIGAGQTMSPFSDLRQQQPDVWARCVAVLRQVEEN